VTEPAAAAAVLRAIGLAGQAEVATVACNTGSTTDATTAIVSEAEAAELVVAGPRGYRLTADGRAQVADALAAERAALDPAVTLDLYQRFGAIDRKFKELVTEYQLSDAPTRLSWAVAGMTDVHPAVQELVARATELVARLSPYRARFDTAMEHLQRGDEKYLVSVTLDSYHTIWFQFHEELIEMAGRTRADEE
jgi:pyruvate,orthophosphate dikinase